MEIEKAFKRLLIAKPFYGLFCLSLPKTITRKTETLMVGQAGINLEMLINPDFWQEHTDDEQIALLTHELSHICLQHMFLWDSFEDKELFNIACDMEVNSYIENLPSDACLPSQIGLENGLGVKKYYEELVKQRNQQ